LAPVQVSQDEGRRVLREGIGRPDRASQADETQILGSGYVAVLPASLRVGDDLALRRFSLIEQIPASNQIRRRRGSPLILPRKGIGDPLEDMRERKAQVDVGRIVQLLATPAAGSPFACLSPECSAGGSRVPRDRSDCLAARHRAHRYPDLRGQRQPSLALLQGNSTG
jgi:hypothetical protein